MYITDLGDGGTRCVVDGPWRGPFKSDAGFSRAFECYPFSIPFSQRQSICWLMDTHARMCGTRIAFSFSLMVRKKNYNNKMFDFAYKTYVRTYNKISNCEKHLCILMTRRLRFGWVVFDVWQRN